MKTMLPGFLLASLAVLAAGCRSSETVRPAAVESMTARVVKSSRVEAQVELRATGTVHARETAVISAQVMGRIAQVLVRAGDGVRAGETLVVLDGAAQQASAAQAQAAISTAQNQQAAAESNAGLAASTLARYRQLQSQRSVSPQEMDEVTRRAQAAEAQLEAAKAQTQAAREQAAAAQTMLGYTRIAAPFAGVVTARAADPGTMAAPGMPLLQIDRSGPLQLQAAVDESAIATVHVGMKVPVTVDGLPQPRLGKVAEVMPVADPSSHSFVVKLDLPLSNQLRAGMYGWAEFPRGTHQAIVVPRSAVVTRGSLECAYVLDGNDVAQLRYLTLGTAHGDLVEVLSGVAAGERLVDTPEDRDLAGKRIVARNGVQP